MSLGALAALLLELSQAPRFLTALVLLLAGGLALARRARWMGSLALSAGLLFAVRDVGLLGHGAGVGGGSLVREVKERFRDAEGLLRATAGRAATALAEPGTEAAAFEQLAAVGRGTGSGLGLYGRDGVIAWSGRTTRLAPGARTPGLHLLAGEGQGILLLVTATRDGRLVVAERPVARILAGLEMVRVFPASSLDLEALSSGGAARWPDPLTSPTRILLQTADGLPFAVASLPAEALAPAGGGELAGVIAALGLLVLLLLLAAVAAREAGGLGLAGRGGGRALALALVLFAAVRVAARVSTVEADWASWPIFSPDRLAVVSPLDLFSSPGDLLLTGLTAVAMALTVLASPRPERHRDRGLGQPTPPAKPGAPTGFAGGVATAGAPGQAAAVAATAGTAVLAAIGAHGLIALIHRMAENSTLDLADFSLLPFDPTRSAVLVGLTLLALAFVAVAARLFTAGLARPGSSGGPLVLPPAASPRAEILPGLLVWSAVALLAIHLLSLLAGRTAVDQALLPRALLYAVPALAGAAWERLGNQRVAAVAALAMLATGLCLLGAGRVETSLALRSFVANDLAPTLRRHEATVRVLIEDVLHDLEGRHGDELAGRMPDDIAYRVWKDSRLARERHRSVVEVRTPSGEAARFSFRLAVPPHLRDVEPPNITLQEVPFQGRRLQVLAGSRALPDGTRVTLRVAEEPQALPFFQDLRQPRDVLVPGGVNPALPLLRAGAELTVTDGEGNVLYSSAPAPIPADDAVLARARSSLGGSAEDDDRFWWRYDSAGYVLDVLSFASDDDTRLLSIGLPRPSLTASLASVLHLILFLGALAALGLLLLAPLSQRLRRSLPRPGWVLSSAYRKSFVGLAAGAILAALASSLYLRSRAEAQALQEIRDRGVAALESARNILAEFSAAEPGGAVDDSTLIWVSQTIGYDLALFRGDALVATSMRELFRDRLLSERPDPRAYRALRLRREPLHTVLQRVGGPISFQASMRLGGDSILTLISAAHERDIEQAVAARNQPLFLATAGLILAAAVLARVAARRATAPLRALTAAAARVAAGDFAVRIDSRRRDEVRSLVDAFNRMARELEEKQQALVAHAEYLSRLLENAPIGILSTDPEGVVTTANPAARSLLGAAIEPGLRLQTWLDRPGLDRLLERLGPDRPPAREQIELRLKPAAGDEPEPRTLRVVTLPLLVAGSSRPGHLILIEDVSELVKSKKLEAWAEMARRIAHEIKNPLTPVQLATEHVLRVWRDRRPGFEPVLEECTATILRQVQYLRRIAREFSAFAKGPTPVHRTPIEVGPWLEEVVDPYRVAPRPGLELELDLAPGLGKQSLDAARLQRAVVNLIENALLAMPEGGVLTVAARRTPPGVGGELVIEVADTGVGIPAEVLDRLFEPYFSTRDAGTGLGLVNARQAVEDHGGRIEIESAPGKGTRVRLRLPESPLE